MIPRILVPKNARPVASDSDAPPRRVSSDLDARTLVPSNLPHFELDSRSSIPSYFKLEVLGAATVVPRDNMPTTPLDPVSKMPAYVPLSILDSRVAVPKDAHASKLEPKQLVAKLIYWRGLWRNAPRPGMPSRGFPRSRFILQSFF